MLAMFLLNTTYLEVLGWVINAGGLSITLPPAKQNTFRQGFPRTRRLKLRPTHWHVPELTSLVVHLYFGVCPGKFNVH